MTAQEVYAKYLQERDNVLRKVAAWLNEHAAFVNGLPLTKWQQQVLQDIVAPKSRGRGFVWSDLVKDIHAEREGNG